MAIWLNPKGPLGPSGSPLFYLVGRSKRIVTFLRSPGNECISPPKELIFNVLLGIFEKQITLFIIWVIQSFFYSLLMPYLEERQAFLA